MTTKSKIFTIIIVACVFCTALSIYTAADKIISQGEESLVKKSQDVLTNLEFARTYVASQGGLQPIVETIIQKYPDGNIPKEEKENIIKQVPVYSALKIGEEGGKKNGYIFRVFSDEPRRKENLATVEELKILNEFKNSDKKEIVKITEDKVYVYRPVRLLDSEGCDTCHGNPEKSPWKNGKDILGFKMENWADGKLHGVFTVINDKKEIKEASTKAIFGIIGWGTLASILCLGLAYYFLNKPLEDLNKISDQLKAIAGSITSAAHEISATSETLSQSSTETAANLEQTSSSTEEVSSMVRMNAENASNAKTLSEECQQKAQIGQKEVTDLIQSMEQISESSKKISEILNVIEDISFQTNLLALNAAVEAARAGEQGRGFAVVADAVRSLAQRSASSAKEISELIHDSVEKAQAGYEIAQKSGKSLNEIVSAVEKVSALNQEIAMASNEQAQGIVMINKNIIELDQVTQKNAALAEQAAASSQELNFMATDLHSNTTGLVSFIAGKNVSDNNSHSDSSVVKGVFGNIFKKSA